MPFEIGSASARSAGPTLKSEIAKPIASRKAKTSAPRESSCSACHPFYTGKQKLMDTGGRVERFQRRLEKADREKADKA